MPAIRLIPAVSVRRVLGPSRISEKPHDIADATSWLVNPPSGPTAITTLSGGRVMISIVFEPFGQRISFASVGSDADGPEIKLSSDWNVSILGMRVLPLCSQAAIATLFQWTFFLFNWWCMFVRIFIILS